MHQVVEERSAERMETTNMILEITIAFNQLCLSIAFLFYKNMSGCGVGK
jgi:hypothetical protein